MNFACTQENLAQGLSLVGHIAGKNVNLPILGNVLLKAENGNVKLATTNLEMAVSVLIRGKVEKPGEFTVPAKLLMDFISLLPAGKVELSVQDDVLEIKADGKMTRIKGIQASEFPLIPKLVKEQGYKVEANTLRQAIGQVAFAVSSSESRPELAGIACFFHGQAGQDRVVMAATDSYRLAERTIALAAGGNDKQAKCIVPARALVEVARILSAYKDDVATPEIAEWAISDNQFVLSYGNVELVSRLIEGSFPDYRQIIPTQFRSVMQVSRSEFLKAIRSAALFARQGLFDVHLEVFADGRMTVSSADTGTGAHTTTLRVENALEPNKVTVNFKYVTDGLSAASADEIKIHIIDGMNPVVVTSSNDNGFQYVIMPIRQ